MHKSLISFFTANFKHHLFFLAIITACTLAAYSNIFSNQLVWDDTSFILDWDQPKQLATQWQNLLQGDLPATQLGIYRPIRSLLYAAGFQLWGYQPFGYHFQSILIHLAATLTTYFITLKLTHSQSTSFISSLLFGIHPLHTEAVTWITASHDTIGLLFFLISFLLYLHSQPSTPIKNLSLIFAFLAAFTYELTLTLPLAIFAHQLLFTKHTPKSALKQTQPYLIASLSFFLVRFGLLKLPSRSRLILGDYLATLLVSLVALVKYLQLSILPINLSVNHYLLPGISSFFHHDFNPLNPPPTPSITQPTILISLLLISSLIFIGFKLAKPKPIITFALAWFFITLIPVLNIIPTATVFTERYAYLAVYGPILIFSFFITQSYFLTKTKPIQITFFAATALLATFFIHQTRTRNQNWHNPLTLWQKTLAQTPQSSFVHNDLSKAFADRGDTDQAIHHNQIAVDLNPHNAVNWANLALLQAQQADFESAITNYHKAISIKPRYFQAHTKLADAYRQLNQTDTALDHYHKAIAIDPYYLPAYINASSVYLESNQPDQALELLATAQKLAPNRPSLYLAFAYVYLSTGQHDLAHQAITRGLALEPTHPVLVELQSQINH